jgi:hypothetical protein
LGSAPLGSQILTTAALDRSCWSALSCAVNMIYLSSAQRLLFDAACVSWMPACHIVSCRVCAAASGEAGGHFAPSVPHESRCLESVLQHATCHL